MASDSGTIKRSFKSVSILPKKSNQQDAIGIFKFDTKTGKMILYEDQLELLKNDKFKDYKVCVISVNGSYRTGKSFLLNFFLHCLKKKCQSVQGEWMDVNDTLTHGFLWKKSAQRVTDGILIYPEIFLTTTKEGEKMAIILMDTQGMSDHQTSYNECIKIFALSALISSVHIYNIQNKLDLEQLGVLQLFAGYGAMFSDNEKKPFQDLYILVRDWINFEDYDFGFEGGKELLTFTFKGHQQSNLSGIQKTIKDNFEKVQCFLMPKPGNQVETREFKGDFNDINKIFRDHVQTFVEKLLSSKNLVPKKINNKFVTVEELFRFIDGYWRCINETEELCTESIYMATAEISLRHLVNRKVDEYKKRLGSCTDTTQAKNEESKILNEFEKAREMKLGTEQTRGSFKQQLTELLYALLNEFRTILDHEDELGNEYIEQVQECTTLEQVEKIKNGILKKFLKMIKHFNYLKEAQEISKQRLTRLVDKVYTDFLMLLDHVNEFKMEYIEHVKECITLKETPKAKETILKKFQHDTNNMDCNEQLRDCFKQRLTKLLDEMYKQFYTLLDLMDQLIEKYTTTVKKCRTLEQAQEVMSGILGEFQEKGENIHCGKELQDHFKRRLSAQLEKVYNDFHILFDHVNQLIEEYSERVKGFRTLEEAQAEIQIILVTIEEENLNCEKELRHHFKKRLKASLDKVCDDFRILFNHVNHLTDKYFNLVKECRTLEDAQETIKRILVTFEEENLNCDNELRDHFKQRLNALLDKVYDDFCLHSNNVNQLINEYSECIKQYRTLEEAEVERQRILVRFEEENLNGEKELRDHFKKRLNTLLDKVYNDFRIRFNHVNHLTDKYFNFVKGCRTLEDAQETITRILVTFEEDTLNCDMELRDHFKERLKASLDKVCDDFRILFNHINYLTHKYFNLVKGCRTLEDAQETIKRILVTFEEETLNCDMELRDHFKNRLKASLDKVCDDFRILFNRVNHLTDKYFNLVKECRTLEDAQESIKRILVTFEEENLNCDNELRDHFKQRLNALLDKVYDDFCLHSNNVNQLINEYSECIKQYRTLEEAEVERQRILVRFEEENLNGEKELRDHFKKRLNTLLDKVYNDFRIRFNHVNRLVEEYFEHVKGCRTLRTAKTEKQRILETAEEENLNGDIQLGDHFQQRLYELLDKVYDDFCVIFNYVKQLIDEYLESIKQYRTLDEALAERLRISVIFDEQKFNCKKKLQDHFRKRLDAALQKVYTNFRIPCEYVKKLIVEYSTFVKECRTLADAKKKMQGIVVTFEEKELNCEDELRNIFGTYLKEECSQIYENNKTEIGMRHVDDVSEGIGKWTSNILGAAGAVVGRMKGGAGLSVILTGAGGLVGIGLGAAARGIGTLIVKRKKNG